MSKDQRPKTKDQSPKFKVQSSKFKAHLFFRVLCFSIIRSGVAKKSNSSRRRFCRYRKYEKCSPDFPPEVNSTNVGGRTPTCVMYCTCKRETPPLTGAGALPPRGCETACSKNALS